MTLTSGHWLPVTINFLRREVQVEPQFIHTMGDSMDRLPVEMVRFINTPVAQAFHKGRNIAWVGSIVIALIVGLLLNAVAVNTMLTFAVMLSMIGLNGTVVWLRFRSHASTPLAVNMHHPFMDGEPMGDAVLYVQLSNGTWIDPGLHRLRIIPDDLIGGFSLAQDTVDFPVLGHFSTSKERTPELVRHMALINQAIALRDAVNEVPDPIEDARERESIETGLLERSWLEEDVELEVESPLVSFFRGKE